MGTVTLGEEVLQQEESWVLNIALKLAFGKDLSCLLVVGRIVSVSGRSSEVECLSTMLEALSSDSHTTVRNSFWLLICLMS